MLQYTVCVSLCLCVFGCVCRLPLTWEVHAIFHTKYFLFFYTNVSCSKVLCFYKTMEVWNLFDQMLKSCQLMHGFQNVNWPSEQVQVINWYKHDYWGHSTTVKNTSSYSYSVPYTINGERFAGLNFCGFHGFWVYRKSFPVTF